MLSGQNPEPLTRGVGQLPGRGLGNSFIQRLSGFPACLAKLELNALNIKA